MYVDGGLVATTTVVLATPTAQVLSLGGLSSAPSTYPFKGYISSVRVSSGVRYMGAFVPGALAPDATTALSWDFADWSGGTVSDGSGGGRIGSVVGATWSGVCP